MSPTQNQLWGFESQHSGFHLSVTPGYPGRKVLEFHVSRPLSEPLVYYRASNVLPECDQWQNGAEGSLLSGTVLIERELPDNTLSILQGASEAGGSSEETSATQRKAERGRQRHIQ